ncbi:MAG: PQQ-dependent sugar dehydrogenase [Deltaproteobacteria bacterium]|nr:PQQ-dependent sugar dehydrogenase [Deltaproteobacteria bacterium]
MGLYGLSSRPSNTTCVAPARPTLNTSAAVRQTFTNIGFNAPVGLYQMPGDPSYWYVIEQGGRVWRFPNDPNVTQSQVTLVLDIHTEVHYDGQEMGLLGMAFDPNFATNHEVFLFYTHTSSTAPGRSTLSRFTSSDNGVTFDASSESVLLAFDKPYENHNGGNIVFGPDGYLYIGIGDGGSGYDPQHNGQNTQVWFGKMLRIDVHSGSPYGIPPSNPFAGNASAGLPEIYAYGLRNPWRWSFDSATGDLWVGDVGQDRYEEIDTPLQNGGNYGWSVCEGFQLIDDSGPCNVPGTILPVYAYSHASGDGNVIIGGFVYHGSALPDLDGLYIYSDEGSGNIWALTSDATGAYAPTVLDGVGGISSWQEGQDGELYATNVGDGNIYKLVPSGGTTSNFPLTLSATGCVNPNDATQPAAGMIPYDVNAKLWSDGAQKDRYFAIPDGTTIHVNSDGDWDLPIGSVVMKTFYVNGIRTETRLMVHHQDGDWAGYTYRWNSAGTDADLETGADTEDVGGQTWYFPSRSQCMQCHTTAAGRTLGLENGQLNRTLTYASSGITANELDTLDHIGMFDAPLGGSQNIEAYPDPFGTDALESRAKAYLHVNCSICHRPGGPGQGPEDFRYDTSTHDMGACGTAPTQGDLGISGAELIAPGDPAHSIVSARIHALGLNAMPPLAKHQLDTNGISLIDGWITSLTSCP